MEKLSIELITPEIAQEILSKAGQTDFINRSLSQATVRKYARLMQNNEWTISNDAICIAKDGSLLNGQHRLQAIIYSGVSVPMTILTGMDKATFAYMDRGKTRSNGDILSVFNIKNANYVGYAILAIIAYLKHCSFSYSSTHFEEASIAKYACIYHKYADIFDAGCAYYYAQRQEKLLSPKIAVAFFVILASIHFEQAKWLFEKIIYGENIARGNTYYTLRKVLLQYKDTTQHVRILKTSTAMILAWNALLRGANNIKVFRWKNKTLPPILGFDRAKFLEGLPDMGLGEE